MAYSVVFTFDYFSLSDDNFFSKAGTKDKNCSYTNIY